jgi:hypothetical protein
MAVGFDNIAAGDTGLQEMHMSKLMLRRLFDSAVWAFMGLALAQLGCDSKQPAEVPQAWSMDFNGKTLGEIHSTIGHPTESSSAKQFENWVLISEEETKMLKVICPERCADQERATEVWFLTFKGGSSTPSSRLRL